MIRVIFLIGTLRLQSRERRHWRGASPGLEPGASGLAMLFGVEATRRAYEEQERKPAGIAELT
jgi:hypothetical protein